MTNTNLIIAIVFASLFGFFTLYFALWCVGCYMHRHCLDLGQYFHTWSLQPAQPAVVCVEKHYSRDGRNMGGRRPERLQIRDDEYRDCEEGRKRGGNGDTRPGVQHAMQAQDEARRQPYRPSLKRKEGVQNMQPMIQQQIPMHWQAPGTSKPDQGLPGYQPQGLYQYHQPHEESVGPETSGARENFSVIGQSPVKDASRARRVDYIHICDGYPPIVLEALKKAAPASPTASSSASWLSSSNGSGTTQEIPRTSIGCATPEYVTSSPMQFPRYCHFAAGARDSAR